VKKYIIFISILVFSLYTYGCKGEFFGPGMADFSYKLSGNYKLFHAGKTEIRSGNSSGGVKIIEPDITGIAWNEDSILVRQKIKKSINYWIIDVKTGRMYGPLDEKKFELEKKNLKINDQLKLENPEKYKHLDEANKNMAS
jgi:hypothetical protein